MKLSIPTTTLFAFVVTSCALFADDTSLSVEPLPLINPGFEERLNGWTIRNNEVGVVDDGVAARSGHGGIRILDESENMDDNVQLDSSPVSAVPFGNYLLTFWARSESGTDSWGVGGVEIAFFDFAGVALTSMRPATTVVNTNGEWTRYTLGVTAPPAALTLVVRIVSYSSSKGSIEFDDFTLVRILD